MYSNKSRVSTTAAKTLEPISKAAQPSLQYRLMTKDGPREALQQLADTTLGTPQYWSCHDCSSTNQAAAASPHLATAAAMQEQRRRMRGWQRRSILQKCAIFQMREPLETVKGHPEQGPKIPNESLVELLCNPSTISNQLSKATFDWWCLNFHCLTAGRAQKHSGK